jgi:glycosyltransferase involved in cell wall biosynthesis
MPVFNGERFLAETIAGFLAQTAGDFHLIISDDASSDATEEIGREFARTDNRVKYFRNEENLGAANNYTRCFLLASSPYFKWAAHDDLCVPELLERSVEALRERADVVVAHARVQSIDPDGVILKSWPSRANLDHSHPLVRTADVLTTHETFPMWGLMRREVLADTGLLGSYAEHERPLLFELALAGRFHEIDDFLFLDREHPERSIRMFDPRDPHAAVAWYDKRLEGRLVFPAWRLLGEYLSALHRSKVRPQDYSPYIGQLADWSVRHRAELVRDLGVAGERLPAVGPIVSQLRGRVERIQWDANVDRLVDDLGRAISDGATIAMIDEQSIDRERLARWIVREFPENDGLWDGLPISADSALAALDRQIETGTSYLVFAESSFWWFDHYQDFTDAVERRHRRIADTSRVLVFAVEEPPDGLSGASQQ